MKRGLPWQKLTLVTLSIMILSVLLPNLIDSQNYKIQSSHQALAASSALTFESLKSVDVMKYTKDVMTNQPSTATIKNLVSTLASMPITHIAVSLPMDPSSDYPAVGKPYPQDAYVFTQAWADAIHAAGLHILWRGTWSGIEGIYNFPKRVGPTRLPAGTALTAVADGNSTWLGKTYRYINDHPAFFAGGDIWAPLPERTEGIFQDSTSFLPYGGLGIQTNYVNFFNNLKTVSDAAFAKIGKNVYTGYTANNYTEVKSGWLGQSLFDQSGIIAIDYYGSTHTPEEMDADLRTMASQHKHPIFLQEWGDYWNIALDQTSRTEYLQRIYTTLQELVADGVLAGFNYWGGWDNSAEGMLTKDDSGFHLNYRGQLLSQLFSPPAISIVGTPDSTLPTTPLSCPAPASNAFTGCYYNDQNLTKLGLVRTDQSINFDWGTVSPGADIAGDHFSARWVGTFNFSGGSYIFTMASDDGSILYINNQPIINNWTEQHGSTNTATVEMLPGIHTIRMEYYDDISSATARLSWELKPEKTHGNQKKK